jgi:hypothetical protein
MKRNKQRPVGWFLLSAIVPFLVACKGEIHSPAAAISGISPTVVCAVQNTTPVTIAGSGFAPLPVGTLTESPQLELPRVLLSQRTKLDNSAGAATEVRVYDGADQQHVRWTSDAEMKFDVYPKMVVTDQATGAAGTDLPYGLYDVAVQNPDSVSAVQQSALTVVPPPTLTKVTPNPACNEQAEASFTLTGTNFITINGVLPSAVFMLADGTGMALSATAKAVGQCATLPTAAGTTAQSCSELTISVPQGTLLPASYRVVVTNPGAANCVTQEDVRTVVIPAPVVSSVMSLAVCSIADTTLQITGANFLSILQPALQNPTITIGSMTFPTTASNCSAIADAPDAQLCTTLSFTVPKAALAIGSYQAVVQNPGQDACSTRMTLNIDVVGPPTVSAVAPKVICSGGSTLNITGTNLYNGGTALIGIVPSAMMSVSAGGTMAAALFPGPLALGGPFPLTVRNQVGCEATLPNAVTVTAGPSILFVDPPAVPNVTTIQATVYATGVSAPIKKISIAPTGTATFTDLVLALDPLFPNRGLVTIPAGLAAGKYDVRLDDQSTCQAFLPGALKVVSQATLTVTGISPAFGSTAQDTAGVITGAGFVSTPRAYLSPSGAGGKAQALAAVTFQSATSLSAVVRAGLAPGKYDLIIVNPDGSYGIKAMAYTVTTAAAPPPVITSIAPSSFVTGSATPATINGSGFRAGATVSLSCQDALGAAVGGASGSAGTITDPKMSVTLTATGAVCIVRVTNQDGTYFDYSAVGVTNSSVNLGGFKAGSNMTTGRRALAAAAGRPTPVARFVYAIGGDNGADNKPLASVEAAPTAINGDLGTFAQLSQSLPKALSFQGVASLGRFLYAVGGFDGAAAVKDVYRAEILNPLAAPAVSDADVRYDAVNGLTAGVYTYRVAAVMAAADANNPGGETLASDFFPIQLPAVAGGAGRLQVTVFWGTVAGAQSYRIYRSPKVNDAAGKELLLATVAGVAGLTQKFTDDGTVTPAGAAALPLGSTGVWRPIAALATARAGAGVAVAQDPTDATKWYLYAVGGNSGTLAAPTALSSIEFLPITLVNGGAQQNFTTWTAATNSLSKGRWALSALTATAANNSVVTVPTDTYLYAASGSTTGLTALDGLVEVAKVSAGGQTSVFTDARTAGTGIKRPGYGGALVNNQLMSFGGFQAGAAVTQSDTSTMSSATTLGNFNSLGGGALKSARALQGTALESAFVYQLGGANLGVNTAQNTTEQTVW